MEETSKKTASDPLAETLQRLTGRGDAMDTFAVSLFRSKTSGQVLYLEAGKDLVDTLLSFLFLPVGTIIHMLAAGVSQEQHYGALSSIYKSIEKLDSELLYVDRNFILAQPRPAANNPSGFSKASTSTPKKEPVLTQLLYKCNHCRSLTIARGDCCHSCGPGFGHSNLEGPYYLSPENVQKLHDLVAKQPLVEESNRTTRPGFVKENITFMVTDKLEIMPSTTIEIMSVLKERKVDSMADLERKKITVTVTQVLQLLQIAVTSNSCLNDVFGTGETG